MIKIEKVLIFNVVKHSIADEIGLKKGDYILTVNGEKIIDILDYKFHMGDNFIEIEIEHEDGELEIYEIEKEYDEDLGIEFENELIDKPKNCHNKCIFCFMEQLPKNVRKTLVFKDDDYRLSFFTGNYITMTNMKDSDVDRIIRYRLSQINISVHATDEKVRCMMLNNKFAGKVLEYLDRLSEANITINTQIVLCKGINDGKVLEKSISDLEKYIPSLNSICIVPVGLSKNRDGLFLLESLTSMDCRDTIDKVSIYQKKFKEKYGRNFLYLADEFYLKANMKFPNYYSYNGFEQIEDGIGMISLFEHDFNIYYNKLKKDVFSSLSNTDLHTNGECKELKNDKVITLVTGKITENYISKKVRKIQKLYPNIHVNVIGIENGYFGPEVTVTGLVTGNDIINTIKSKIENENMQIGDYVIVPQIMLKDDEDIFLDDTTLIDLQNKINKNIVISNGSVESFIHSIVDKMPNVKIFKQSEKINSQSYENSIKL